LRLALATVVALTGCGVADQSLMPMEVGARSRYEVQAPFNEFIAEVRILRKSAVGGNDGYVLSGPTGESHLAWDGQTLIAERMSNTRFVPPIPLAVDSKDPIRRKWRGKVEGYWGRYDAEATLDQAWIKEFEGKQIRGVKAVLTIKNPSKKALKLTTVFQPGVGIAFQRQATGGDSIVKIDRLSGS
jgi:hypothetical protein